MNVIKRIISVLIARIAFIGLLGGIAWGLIFLTYSVVSPENPPIIRILLAVLIVIGLLTFNVELTLKRPEGGDESDEE